MFKNFFKKIAFFAMGLTLVLVNLTPVYAAKSLDVKLNTYTLDSNGARTSNIDFGELQPGQIKDYIINVEIPSSSKPAYVRVKVDFGQFSQKDEILYDLTTGWVYTNGYYYCQRSIPSGSSVDLCRKMKVPDLTSWAGGDFSITAEAECIEDTGFVPDFTKLDPWSNADTTKSSDRSYDPNNSYGSNNSYNKYDPYNNYSGNRYSSNNSNNSNYNRGVNSTTDPYSSTSSSNSNPNSNLNSGSRVDSNNDGKADVAGVLGAIREDIPEQGVLGAIRNNVATGDTLQIFVGFCMVVVCTIALIILGVVESVKYLKRRTTGGISE